MNWRYELLPGDFSRLYRRYYREQGINVDVPPEENVDNWLQKSDSGKRLHNATISAAVFHYSPRTTANERFEIGIATNEMIQATWKYVHGKQLILDGTFGLCTSRLLLWIAMGVDESNHGVPVALFLFSAPTGTQATHAGYDTKILIKLLQIWKDSLGRRNGDGVTFEPCVAITDTDTKERAALIHTWPKIKLLLCKFHIRQCWTNKREALLGKGGTDFFKMHVEKRIRSFEDQYVSFYILFHSDSENCVDRFQ
jgi:MULE transposase domain